MMPKALPAAFVALLLTAAAGQAQTAAPAAATPEPAAEATGDAMAGTGKAESEADDDDDDDAAEAAAPAATTAVQHHDFGPSGIMTRSNREDLAPLTLASGKPVASATYELKSGGYYRIDITADGSAELALSGGDFFRAIWINEVVVNDIEIRPMGIHSIEFDEAGTASLSFIAIQPGTFTLSIPGSTGETQKATFTIR